MQGFTTMVRRIWSALLKAKAGFVWYVPVSYTHLTLPMILRV